MSSAKSSSKDRDNDYPDRFVRYCSRACQKAAWPTHKQRCHTGADFQALLDEDEEAKAINRAFSQWLACWRNTLHTVAISALNLANSLPDKLATHFVFLEMERRPNPPSVLQSFRMLHGEVMSRDDFVEVLRKEDCTQDEIDDWRNDDRGDHTVHIAIKFGTFMRFLWFSLRGLGRWRNVDKATADKLAANWVHALMGSIEMGSHRIRNGNII
ncbi:hypothetical protein OBBRIDRAFT_886968 [Obba rivulosa]|uniref:MYND-type domain-containing protein n=1 Tax=Obba rivulosa TaxID=1052685 RepID=A0A8E2AW48_9APHY|nr:hypothetical protein OBBRIDRAFT_886968 [Obba rivulosa]